MPKRKNALTKTPTIAKSPNGYFPCGKLREIWGSCARNLMISGHYGTGKTRWGFERFNLYMCVFPGSVGVMARKTYDDLVPLLNSAAQSHDAIFDDLILMLSVCSVHTSGGVDPTDHTMPVMGWFGRTGIRLSHRGACHSEPSNSQALAAYLRRRLGDVRTSRLFVVGY